MSYQLKSFVMLLGSFIISFIVSFLLIKYLLSIKTRGQVERSFTLDTHIKKDGTPNTGGIAIIISILLTSLIFGIDLFYDKKAIVLLLVFLVFFLVGLIDDFFKIKFNSYEGLSSKIRLLFELSCTLFAISLLNYNFSIFSFIEITLLDIVIPIGIFLIPLILLIVVGVSNSVNLTDGLDGLASGMMLLSLLPIVIVSINNEEYNIAIILVSTLGSLSSFLIFNLHPAKIFMGDCGALSLGALLAFSSIILNEYLLLFISSSFFVFETFSVIIQVLYYKSTKKRIFLMAPFHHHLEKKGYPEWKIVMFCWVYGFVCSIVCILMEVL